MTVTALAPVSEPDTVRAEAAFGLGRHLRDRLVESLEAADERKVRRIAHADTSVAFCIEGQHVAACTILCDRLPPVVCDGEEPAEASILLTAAQARLFCAGELNLPSLLLDGEIAYDGSPRKFMAVAPIVRALLAQTADGSRRRR